MPKCQIYQTRYRNAVYRNVLDCLKILALCSSAALCEPLLPSFNRHDGISLLLPLQARAFLRAQLEEALVCLRGAPGKLDNFVLQDGKGCEGEEEGAGLC